MRKRLLKRWGLSGLILCCLSFIVFASWKELRLFSIDAQSGKVRWSKVLDSFNGEAMTPVIHNGKLFLQIIRTDSKGQGWQQISAFSTQTGQPIWERNFFSDYAEKAIIRQIALPVATPQTLIVNLPIRSNDHFNQMVVFDRETGDYKQVSQRFFRSFRGKTSLFPHNQILWMMTFDQFPIWETGCDQAKVVLKKQDLWLKQTQWEFRLPEQFCRSQLTSHDEFLIANEHSVYFKDGEKIQVRDAESGELKFQLSTPVKKIGLTGNTFLISDRNSVTAFDAKTGKNKWRSEGICGAGSTTNNLTTDSDTLYIQCDPDPDYRYISRYGITALKVNNGKKKWFSQLKTDIFHTPSIASEYIAVIDATHQRWLSNSKSAVTILSKIDGSIQSRFPISSASIAQSVSADQTHFYFVDRSPRWRHWISHWNPNWH